MKRPRPRLALPLAGALALGAAIALLLWRGAPLAQQPRTVTPMADQPIGATLAALEAELARANPEAAAALRPGISAEGLQRAERELGLALHADLRQLYLWHDGAADDVELFPGHSFVSLEAAVQENQELARQYAERGLSLMMAGERHWLSLFADPAGDGYYYDPSRPYAGGGVFYVFRETGYLIRFPSLGHLLAAVVECYRAGAYPRGGEPDFVLEQQIMLRYGVEAGAP